MVENIWFPIHLFIAHTKFNFNILFIKEFNYETLTFLDCRIPGSGAPELFCRPDGIRTIISRQELLRAPCCVVRHTAAIGRRGATVPAHSTAAYTTTNALIYANFGEIIVLNQVMTYMGKKI